jgi:hypothetical protein
MSEPRRLLDDDTLGQALRSALVAEAASVDTSELSALSARVMDGVAAGTVPAAMAASVAAASAPAAKVGVFAALGGLSSTTTGLTGAALGVALGVALGAGGHALYVDATRGSPPPVIVERDVVIERDVVESAGADSAPKVQGVALDGDVASLASTTKPNAQHAKEPTPKPPSTTASEDVLARELRVYERGEEALKNRRFEVALSELDAYLREFPKGALVVEAELARLEAMLGLARSDAALSLALRLGSDKRFAAQRARIAVARIEALTSLGRCAEASAVRTAATLDARSAARTDALLAACVAR